MLSAPFAHAQIFSDTVAREQSVKNEQQIKEMARIVRNIRDQVGALSQKQQGIEQQLRNILGQLKEADAKQASIQQDYAKTDGERKKINQRITDLSGDIAALNERIQQMIDMQKTAEKLFPEEKLYTRAFKYYQNNQHEDAVDGFEQIITLYPQGKFNVNARYWMGQSLMALKKYQMAIMTMQDIIDIYGGSDKAPDAMLTLAQAQIKLEAPQKSKDILERLIASYPTTLAADKARQLLAP